MWRANSRAVASYVPPEVKPTVIDIFERSCASAGDDIAAVTSSAAIFPRKDISLMAFSPDCAST